jgi:hypothetical protein
MGTFFIKKYVLVSWSCNPIFINYLSTPKKRLVYVGMDKVK